jgi:hypothetical protein
VGRPHHHVFSPSELFRRYNEGGPPVAPVLQLLTSACHRDGGAVEAVRLNLRRSMHSVLTIFSG